MSPRRITRRNNLKLLKLKIRNIRGVKRLDLSPNGETFAIVGNNGTGKSAVVDAIDFLLTGDMGRLMGRRGVSLRDHGKHITAEPSDCYVEGTFNVSGISVPVTLRRSFEDPTVLEAPCEALVRLEPFLAVALQRQYILNRESILRFISARPADRAALVQAVLNLDRVEELRQILTAASNNEKRGHDVARAARISAEAAPPETLGIAAWSDQAALDAVNRLRELLGGPRVESLADATRDLTPPGVLSRDAVAPPQEAPSDILGDIRRVGISVSEANEAQVNAWDEVLRTEATTLSASPEKARAARQIELVELGITLLDDATKCPLCDTDWNPEPLRRHLDAKAETGRAAAPSWNRLRETADSMLRWLADTEQSISRIVEAGRQGDEGSDPALLAQYSQALGLLRTALADPLSLILPFRERGRTLSEQLGMSAARELLRSLFRERQQVAAADPGQVAWATLIRAEENFKALTAAKRTEASALVSFSRLEALRTSFIDARDRELGELYNSVKDRFIELYKQLHAPKEQDFDADMTPSDAGLNLEVDFHGTGKVAPFALHSEGHQDSMGLCLFLALAERVQGARLEFCLLDDVVLAIDAGHRLNVAKLLKSLQTETQFLIATHELLWARQLQMEGCVNSRTTTRFIGWSLDGGPIEGHLSDLLEESEAALAGDNVRNAAASLRYDLESFFHFVADSIRAQPPYSLSGQYEMGAMYIACNEKLKELVKKAKQAAESWEQAEVVTALNEFDTRRSEARNGAQIADWAINANVHFNTWMNMTPEEFRPVLEAFKELCSLFKCETCGSTLRVILDGATPKTETCAGGCEPWNLEKRCQPGGARIRVGMSD